MLLGCGGQAGVVCGVKLMKESVDISAGNLMLAGVESANEGGPLRDYENRKCQN